MRFGLIANLNRKGAGEAAKSFLDWAKKRKQQVVVSEKLKNIVPGDFEAVKETDVPENCDIVV